MQSNAPPAGEGVQGGVAYPAPTDAEPHPGAVPGGAASSTGTAQRRPRWRMGRRIALAWVLAKLHPGGDPPLIRPGSPPLPHGRARSTILRYLPAAGHHLSLLHVRLSR